MRAVPFKRLKKHHLPVYHLLLLALDEISPVCLFCLGFFTKIQVSPCPSFTVPQPFWMNTSKHQLKKWAARHPYNAGQTYQYFSFGFFACVKGHAYSPQNANPSHLQGGRESMQPRGSIPRCHQCCMTQRGGTTGHLLQEPPLTGGKDGTDTPCSPLSTASPHSPKHS